MTNQNRCTNIQHAKIKKEETIKVKTRSYTKRQKVVTEKRIMASITYHYNPNVFENNAQIDDGYDDNDAEFGWRDNSPPRLEKLVSFSLQDEEIILPNKSNASDGDSIVIQYGDKLDGAALSVLKKSYPLVESLNGSSVLRKAALEKNGSIIQNSVHSSDSWMRTIFVIRERAFDKFFFPWVIVTINAIIWSIIIDIYKDSFTIQPETIRSLYNLVLTTALAFLLVFRLNRVAIRWWDTRTMWGKIVADARILTSCILEHANHAPESRDEAISCLACYVIAVKQHLRGEKSFQSDEIAGFQIPEKIHTLQHVNHPCLFIAANIRHALKRAFSLDDNASPSKTIVYASHLKYMEKYIDSLINLMGGLERVKSTPLPIVFVTHLRTFLMVYLLSMPYLYGHLWGFGTIPGVSLTAYILLGIDGSASECESPFTLRANHLPMETYCNTVLNDIENLYIEHAIRKQDIWC